MKKIIAFVWPFLLLFLALGFMSQYKQLDDLSDSESYEVRTFVEAAQANNEASEDNTRGESQTASASVTETTENAGDDVNPAKSYAVTSDEDRVTVYDEDGNQVFETSMDDWEEHRDDYYEKYQLGMK